MTLKMMNSIHSFEIAFCGYSGSGKTTLITSLIRDLSNAYSIGYLKHDAHKFIMDKEGKDTYKAKTAGAASIYINSSNGSALLRDSTSSDFDLSDHFIDNDFIFIEGYKNSKIQKILVLGEKQNTKKILDEYRDNNFKNVLAIIGRDEIIENIDIPYFNANSIDSIKNFIISMFKKKYQESPLYGLVLSGGKSSRMGRDKAQLKYHGVNQIDHIYAQLSSVCDETFVSCRSEQSHERYISKHNFIEDQFLNIGPIGGILTAMTKYRRARWFVIACDLPFFSIEDMKYLISESDPFKVATSFLNPDKKWAEPLCTIYEPKSYAKLFKVLGLGKQCPRKVLLNSNIKTVRPINSNSVDNANTPEDLNRAKKYIEVHYEN